MFRRLRASWQRYLQSLPQTEPFDSIPESRWNDPDLLPKVSKARRAAFESLVALLMSHLGAERAQAIARARAPGFVRADEPDVALRDALTQAADDPPSDDDPSAAFIACDWNAPDDLVWQAGRMARAHGLTEPVALTGAGGAPDLEPWGRWLQGQGLALHGFSTGDDQVAFAVPLAACETVARLASTLGLQLQRHGVR